MLVLISLANEAKPTSSPGDPHLFTYLPTASRPTSLGIYPLPATPGYVFTHAFILTPLLTSLLTPLSALNQHQIDTRNTEWTPNRHVIQYQIVNQLHRNLCQDHQIIVPNRRANLRAIDARSSSESTPKVTPYDAQTHVKLAGSHPGSRAVGWVRRYAGRQVGSQERGALRNMYSHRIPWTDRRRLRLSFPNVQLRLQVFSKETNYII